jgi:ABC-2 type transport system permease protein
MTPFPSMVNTPLQLFLGTLAGEEIVWAMLNQLIWAALLLAAAHLVLSRGVRRLVIQGG